MAATNPFAPQGLASQFQNLYYQPGAPATTTYGSTPGFSLNPAPRAGAGAFGAVPGAIGAPNPFGDLSSVYPNLSGTNKQVSADILSKLSGTLSPGTMAAIKDAGAAWGVGAGVPGSGIQTNRSLRDIGLTSEQQQQQGLQDYAALIPTISRTQTVSPELQAQIAATNAQMAAAPDPTQAASYAKQLFDEYLNKLKGSNSPAEASGAIGSRTSRLALGGSRPPEGFPGSEAAPTNFYQQLFSGYF